MVAANGVNYGLAAIGALMIVAGIIATGVVPGLAVTGISGGMPQSTIALRGSNLTVYAWVNTTPTVVGGSTLGTTGGPVATTTVVTLYWGDGTSTHAFPAKHTYSASGKYTVSALIQTAVVRSGVGCAPCVASNATSYRGISTVITLPGSVNVTFVGTIGTTSNAAIIPSFTASVPTNGSRAVTFQDTSQGINETVQSVSWSFGDGGVGSGSFANHTYELNGTYLVVETIVGSARIINTATGAEGTVNYSSSLNITVGQIISKTNPPVTASSSITSIAQVAFTPLATALIIAGIVLLVWQFIPAVDRHYVIGLVVTGGVFAVAFFATGG